MCLVHFLEEMDKRSPVRKYGSKLNMPPRCLEWVVTVSCIAACDRYWFPMAGADYPANCQHASVSLFGREPFLRPGLNLYTPPCATAVKDGPSATAPLRGAKRP